MPPDEGWNMICKKTPYWYIYFLCNYIQHKKISIESFAGRRASSHRCLGQHTLFRIQRRKHSKKQRVVQEIPEYCPKKWDNMENWSAILSLDICAQ